MSLFIDVKHKLILKIKKKIYFVIYLWNSKIILKKYFKRKIYVSSIDDFYKTLKDRNEMSSIINPLLKTRGVPGTHDVNLIKKFFDFIKKKKI